MLVITKMVRARARARERGDIFLLLFNLWFLLLTVRQAQGKRGSNRMRNAFCRLFMTEVERKFKNWCLTSLSVIL